MKKHVILIIVTVLCSFCLVIFINFSADQNFKKNGFVRVMIPKKLILDFVIKLPTKNYLFVPGNETGNEKDLLLQDLSKPDQLLIVSKNYRVGERTLNFEPNSRHISFFKTTDTIYAIPLGSNRMSKVWIGNLLLKSSALPNKGFDQFIRTDNGRFVGRETKMVDASPQRMLTKFINNKNLKSIQIQGTVDQFFSNDGMMKYSAGAKRIIYSYFYRGEFICLDTNLNQIYKGNTIDTIRNPRLNFAKKSTIYSNLTKNSITQSKPAKVVTSNYYVGDKLLFMMSNVKGDNETFSNFRNNQVIDCYLIEDGSYQGSFYIPKFKNLKLRDVVIEQSRVVCLFQQHLIVFRMAATPNSDFRLK